MIFQYKYLLKITKEIFKACGTPEPEAGIVADVLVSSNLMGLDSHGVIRIPQYVRMVQKGDIIPDSPLSILRETPNTAIVDGGWNFGPVSGIRGMQIAIEKAKANSIGCVTVRNCNHAGRLGAYPQLASEENLIGMAVCSSFGGGHYVCPWGGREGRLATNPIAFAVPTEGNPILIDVSTSVVSEGKIRVMRDGGKELPEGWVLDANGKPSTNPKDFYGPPMGVILPLGGKQGYKGYAFSMIVEILGTVLLNEGYEHDEVQARGNGLWLMALDITAFISHEQFKSRINEMVTYLKSSKTAHGFDEVTIPGEIDFRLMARRKEEGVPMEDETWRQIEEVANELGVRP